VTIKALLNKFRQNSKLPHPYSKEGMELISEISIMALGLSTKKPVSRLLSHQCSDKCAAAYVHDSSGSLLVMPSRTSL